MQIIRKWKIFLFIFSSAIGSILANVDSAYAGIGVSPTITELTVASDSITKGAFSVVNDGEEPIHVKVEPEDWLKKTTGASAIPLEEWLTVTPIEFDLEPQGRREVGYAIAPPPGAKGELVAMIFFASSVPTEGAFNITTRFGVSIYAGIKETIELDCDIKNFSLERNIIQKEGGGAIDRGITFIMDLENRGNVHLRPTGNIAVAGPDGAHYDIKIGRGFPIYPGAHLDYAIAWDKSDIPAGIYTALLTLDYGNIYNVDKKIEKEMSFVVGEDGLICKN